MKNKVRGGIVEGLKGEKGRGSDLIIYSKNKKEYKPGVMAKNKFHAFSKQGTTLYLVHFYKVCPQSLLVIVMCENKRAH